MGDNVVGGFEEGRSAPIRFVTAGRTRAGVPAPQFVDMWQEQDAAPPADRESDLVKYWRILLKRKFTIGAVLLAALGVGLAATLLARPTFTATATIQIDREAAKVLNTADVYPGEASASSEEFFQTQYGLLRSRSLAERVVDALGLAGSDAFIAKTTGKHSAVFGKSDTLAQRREKVVSLVEHNLKVSPVRGSRLVNIAYDSADPNLAAAVANAFADNFIESNLDRRYESSSYARDFLQKRLTETKAKLEDSERQLVAYATQQQIINLVEPGAQAGQGTPAPVQSLAASDLQVLNNAHAAAETERLRAEQTWVQAQATPALSLPEVLQSPTIQQLSQERAKVSAEYQDNLRVYKPDFPEMVRIKAQLDELDRQIRAEADNIKASLKAKYLAALKDENALTGKVAGLKTNVLDLRQRTIEYNILQREVDTNRTLYEGLLQRFKEIGVAGGLTTNNISVVDRASAPHRPSRPRPLVNMSIAAFLGLGFGVLGALALEGLDQGVNAPEDLERKLGLPLLGVVPLLQKELTPIQALKDPKSAFADAFYSVNTALQFSTNEGAPRSILVTSTRPSEGKSSSSLAIASNLARAGAKVLLIDADLRNPSLHKTLRAGKADGLSNVLSGARRLSEVVQEVSGSSLAFLPSGPLPPNPAELLSGLRMRLLVSEAGALYDHIVIDGPPVLGLADAPILGSMLGGCVFIIESGTHSAQAKAALQRLHGVNGHVLGGILTKFNPRHATYGAGYGYGYDYGVDEPKKRIGKW